MRPPVTPVRRPSSRRLSSLLLHLAAASLLALTLLAPAPAHAHIGSLNAVFEGLAGNIPVRVIVRPPGVVPGLASIDVRVLTNQVRKVTALPVHWRAGLEGSPPPDVAAPVEGEPGLFHAELWLMATGAYSVHVHVETDHGSGKVIVPVNSLATTRLEMSPLLTGILVALGLLLVTLAASVAGAAVRESVLEPGHAVSSKRRWLGRAAIAAALLLVTAALAGGRAWWNSVDRDYRNNRMFKPVPVTTTILPAPDTNSPATLQLTIDEKKAGRSWGPLVPDHGKLMHLFLIREPALDAFAHLHPARQSSTRFASALPAALPPGTYRVYADVTHENGFAQTLTSKVTLPETAAGNLPNPDPNSPNAGAAATPPSPDREDSHHVGAPSSSRSAEVGEGYRIVWDSATTPVVSQPDNLRFRVLDPAGQPARLEAYMGMLSHLILTREDGAVFNHLHPAGNISMASQQVFQIRSGERPPKRITPEMMEQLCQPPGPELLQQPISFPCEFPKPGSYRLWIQVKTGGTVRTASFTTEVAAAGPTVATR